MDAEQLADFLKTTVNGKSTVRVLKDYGLKVVGARVLVHPDEDDASKNVYNVVLITDPDPDSAKAVKESGNRNAVASGSAPTG